jgi:peptidoglycan/LPS O-acetylase OafA/YrhL
LLSWTKAPKEATLDTPHIVQGKGPRYGWIPALDGIRGLAILMVMVFHYTIELDRSNPIALLAGALCGYGWTGVDLFFVLSGFLITGILLESRTAENYFSSFYMRRLLRIFPAYYISLGLILFVLPMMNPSGSRMLPSAHDRWMYAFYAQNWIGIFHYSAQNVLTPYWSLAVEEQFYLIWPLVVARFAGEKLLRIIGVICIATMLLRFGCMAAGIHPVAIYVNTLTRMDSLLIGAACAVAVRDPRRVESLRRYARWLWLAPFGAFLGVRLISSPSSKTMDPVVQGVGFTAIALSYAGLLLATVLGGNPVLQQFLSSRPMRALGKYSYAAYLWHFAAMPIVRSTIPAHVHVWGVWRMLLMGATTAVLSVSSYYLIERWFLLLKKKFEPRLPAIAPTPTPSQLATYTAAARFAQESARR